MGKDQEMSYARIGKDSDVYIVGTSRDPKKKVIECMGCDLAQPNEMGGTFWWTDTARGMLAHARLHRAAGQKVPDYTIERLEEETAEETAERDAWWEALAAKNQAHREAIEAEDLAQ